MPRSTALSRRIERFNETVAMPALENIACQYCKGKGEFIHRLDNSCFTEFPLNNKGHRLHYRLIPSKELNGIGLKSQMILTHHYIGLYKKDIGLDEKDHDLTQQLGKPFESITSEDLEMDFDNLFKIVTKYLDRI